MRSVLAFSARYASLAFTLGLAFAAASCGKSESKAEGAATAAPDHGKATAVESEAPGNKFGAGVTEARSVAIDEILANPKAFAGQQVKVEGMVTDVCPKRGCWFEMAGGKPGQKMKFKVTDGEMVFPMESKGRYAIAQGTLTVREMSIEDTKKMAEYQAKEYGKPFDPASITEPSLYVQINGTGAVIRDQK